MQKLSAVAWSNLRLRAPYCRRITSCWSLNYRIWKGEVWRQNVRIVGLPESVEGARPTAFFSQLLVEVFGDQVLPSPPELDRAHRTLAPKPGPHERPDTRLKTWSWERHVNKVSWNTMATSSGFMRITVRTFWSSGLNTRGVMAELYPILPPLPCKAAHHSPEQRENVVAVRLWSIQLHLYFGCEFIVNSIACECTTVDKKCILILSQSHRLMLLHALLFIYLYLYFKSAGWAWQFFIFLLLFYFIF